jgi:oligoendopeptidase F
MSETAAAANGRGKNGRVKNEEALPEWDLGDLYPAPDSPEFTGDLERAAGAARDFRQRFEGRLGEADAKALGAMVAEYEGLQETLARLLSYAMLRYAGNATDPEIARFYQTVLEKVNAISAEVLFFTLEINRIDEAALDRRIAESAAASGVLARYAPWLRDVRVFRPHQLSDELERLLLEKSVTGQAAWNRLFDETLAALRVPHDGEQLTCEQALFLLTDRDGAVRRAAAKSLGAALAERAPLFTLVINTLIKDKAVEDSWRRYPSPQASRHLSNFVEAEVVDALVGAVRGAYSRLSHRYYRIKADWMGRERLDYWDRNAPLPEAEERRFSWEQARTLVLAAFEGLSPELGSIGAQFFERRWIDAAVRPGKAGGAFSHSTVPSVHPYILMNYQGKTRDVMTLAHELGHGIHQVLAAPQGQLMADTPLTLAETASVFGEMLAFRAMIEAEADPARRRLLLATKVEDMLNTVVRQIAFYDFESRLHKERRDGELMPERIGEIWLDTQKESLGPVFRFDEEYRYYWTYVSHFVHAPFYVYAYAFGDCLVNSLYAVYEGGPAGFAGKYLEMLRAGGTLRHRELLRPFGLDATEPAFWERGLSLISSFIDEIETEL